MTAPAMSSSPPHHLRTPRRRPTRDQSEEPEDDELNGADDTSISASQPRSATRRTSQDLDDEEFRPTPTSTKSHNHDSLDQSEHHDISGATLLDTEPEGSGVDAELMLDAIPDLERAASSVLEFFTRYTSTANATVELAKQLEDPRSGYSRRLHRLRSNLATQMEAFNTGSYIAVDQIAETLPPVNVTRDLEWRVDGILYKANCAQFALQILTKATLPQAETDFYELVAGFPSQFLSSFDGEPDVNLPGRSNLRNATLNVGLNLRTQLLKAHIVSDADSDALDLVYQVFSNTDDVSDDPENAPLRGFNVPGLQDHNGNLPSRYLDDALAHVQDVKRFLRGGRVDTDGLEIEYPWNAFLYKVANWIRRRDQELSEHLNRQPPFDIARDELENVLKRRNSTSGRSAGPPNFEDVSPSSQLHSEMLLRRSPLGPGSGRSASRSTDRSLGQSEQQLSPGKRQNGTTKAADKDRLMDILRLHGHKPTSADQSGSTVQEDGPDPDKTIVLDDDEDWRESLNQSLMPRKSFIDRQSTASRVSSISDASQIPQDSNQNQRKRDTSAAEHDNDTDQESRSRKRQRLSNTTNNEMASGERRRNLPFAPSDAQTSGSVDHNRTNGATSGEDKECEITEVRTVSHDSDYRPSRPISRLARFFGSPEPQIRRRYTADEEKRLIELIERYGTRWADIKRADEAHPDGPRLSRRSQVQLKDKARNLYIDYLKRGLPLPRNMTHVTMKKDDIDKLKAAGIEVPPRGS